MLHGRKKVTWGLRSPVSSRISDEVRKNSLKVKLPRQPVVILNFEWECSALNILLSKIFLRTVGMLHRTSTFGKTGDSESSFPSTLHVSNYFAWGTLKCRTSSIIIDTALNSTHQKMKNVLLPKYPWISMMVLFVPSKSDAFSLPTSLSSRICDLELCALVKRR